MTTPCSTCKCVGFQLKPFLRAPIVFWGERIEDPMLCPRCHIKHTVRWWKEVNR